MWSPFRTTSNAFFSTTAKPPECSTAVALSDKNRRHSLPPTVDAARNIGGFGRAVLTTLGSNSKSEPVVTQTKTPSIRTSGTRKLKRQQSEGKERELSGSDVLLALQRATAQKLKGKKKDDYSSGKPSKSSRGEGHEDDDDDASSDGTGVRPLCIKSDWGSRLEELESRLQELIDT